MAGFASKFLSASAGRPILNLEIAVDLSYAT